MPGREDLRKCFVKKMSDEWEDNPPTEIFYFHGLFPIGNQYMPIVAVIEDLDDGRLYSANIGDIKMLIKD